VFISRGSQNDAMRHLQWRIRLFAVGAGLGLGGIGLESAWMIWGALAVLLAGMALRFLPDGEEQDGLDDHDRADPAASESPPKADSESIEGD